MNGPSNYRERELIAEPVSTLRPVLSRVDSIHRVQSQTGEVLAELEARLECVTSGLIMEGNKKEGVDQAPSCQMEANLMEIELLASAHRDRLASLLHRLKV